MKGLTPMKAILPAHSLSGYRTGKSFNEVFRFSRQTNLKAVGNYVNKDTKGEIHL